MRGVQVVYGSSKLLGRESRETVFRTTSHAHSHRTGEQPGVQRTSDEQPVQFPAFRFKRDSVVLGQTTAACRETNSTKLRDGAVYKHTTACLPELEDSAETKVIIVIFIR